MDRSLRLIVLIGFWCSVRSMQDDCTPIGYKRFDENISKGTTFGNPNIKFPESQQQLVDWCKKSTRYLNDAETFNKKCNKDLNKQIISVFMFSVRTVFKTYCRPGTKQATQFHQAGNCVNKAKDKEVAAYQKWIDDSLGAQQADDKLKIPHFCCSFYRALDLYQQGVEKKCGQEVAENQIKYTRSLVSNVVDFLCGEYTEDSDKCSQLGSPPKKKKNQKRSKSMAIPVVELFKSFKEI